MPNKMSSVDMSLLIFLCPVKLWRDVLVMMILVGLMLVGTIMMKVIMIY